MADPVTVSVVIPARNAAATLPDTLESLKAQAFADWEAVIVDDQSVDGTASIARAYAAADPRLRVVDGPGRGAAAARNRGIGFASGRWLHFLDADDWVAPSFIGRMVAALGGGAPAVAAHCAYRRVMPDGALGPARIRHDLSADPLHCFARTCGAAIHAVLVDRAVVVRLGGFDAGLQTCEDWDLWQRVARVSGPWVTVDEPLAFYRTHPGSLTRNAAQMMRDCEVVVDRGFGLQDGKSACGRRGTAQAERGAAEAKAYFALWNAACAVGAKEDEVCADQHLRALPHQPHDAHALAMTILDGLMVGAAAAPERLADLWEDYGARLRGLMERLGGLWGDGEAAFAAQLALEGALLDYSPLQTTYRFGRTLGAPVELSALAMPAIGQADVACLNVLDRGTSLGRVTLGVLGDWDRPALARRMVERFGAAALLRAQARTRAAVPIAGRALPALLRTLASEPGALISRPRLKAAIVAAAEPVLAVRARRPAPGTHDSELQALIAAAEADAAQPVLGVVRKAHPGAPPEGARDVPRQVFWDRYFDVEDPWSYGSAYEQEKYAAQLALLPGGRIGEALELACAEGHFSDMLAPRVGSLHAVDISPRAIARAKARCAPHGNAAFSVLDLSRDALPGGMDLITCSEVLYYLRDRDELRAVAGRIAEALAPGGHLITAHAFVLRDDMARTAFDWDDPFGAETISKVFAETPRLALDRSWQCDLYRIDRFRRLRDGEPEPEPREEIHIRKAPLDPPVARQVVWNGAAALRSDVKRSERASGAPVLMYHSVADDGPAALERYRISPAALEQQLTWLRKHGYHPLAPEELAWSLAHRRPLHGRPVMITFDDGFQDFADVAWPLLQAYDFEATVFLVTDRLGGRSVWDAGIAEPAPLMSGSTVRALAAEGVRFGSHLATHRAINGLATRDLAAELARSRAKIAALTGEAPFAVAAPFSIGDRRLAGLAADMGYGLAFAAGSGCARLSDDPLDAPRIEVRGDQSMDQFIAQMEAARR